MLSSYSTVFWFSLYTLQNTFFPSTNCSTLYFSLQTAVHFISPYKLQYIVKLFLLQFLFLPYKNCSTLFTFSYKLHLIFYPLQNAIHIFLPLTIYKLQHFMSSYKLQYTFIFCPVNCSTVYSKIFPTICSTRLNLFFIENK